MKKKVVSLLLVTTMVASLAAGCGDSSSSGDGTEKTGKKVETVDDGHTLTAWAWDPNFNIPALKAAAEDYKKNVDPDFVLNIEEQSGSSDIETAITTAGSAGDYSTLPDIVLFQDHYFRQYNCYDNYHVNKRYITALRRVCKPDKGWTCKCDNHHVTLYL